MGVTGTNGKTSIVNFSQQLIEQKDKSCLTIGTLGSWWSCKFENG